MKLPHLYPNLNSDPHSCQSCQSFDRHMTAWGKRKTWWRVWSSLRGCGRRVSWLKTREHMEGTASASWRPSGRVPAPHPLVFGGARVSHLHVNAAFINGQTITFLVSQTFYNINEQKNCMEVRKHTLWFLSPPPSVPCSAELGPHKLSVPLFPLGR